jgi:hypothetical protein
MYFLIREKFKRQGSNKFNYRNVEEKEFSKVPAVGDAFNIGRKKYKVDAIVISNQSENGDNCIDVTLVPNQYKNDNVRTITRRDRYQHEVVENKDGSYYTVEKNKKKVRGWDKEGRLIYGEPYPSRARAGDGI